VSLSQSLAYPPETALFKALPRLCMSSPMPRIVAHPSKAKTTKSNAERTTSSFSFYLQGGDQRGWHDGFLLSANA
jgi:hypothetical protein